MTTLDRALSDLRDLIGVARELSATTELMPLLGRVESAVRQVLDCERATVFIFDPTDDALFSLVATGVEQIRMPVDRGIAGRAFSQCRSIVVHDAYADPTFNPEVDRKTGFRTRNLLAFPMLGYDGQAVGVLQALNKRRSGFTDRDLENAGALGGLAGVAIQRQRLLDELVAKQRMQRDLAIAREIQRQSLPSRDPEIKGFDIAGWSQPADETGGDCFDFVPLADSQLGLLLADATGHGVGPALIASEFRALVRAVGMFSSDPAFILGQVNRLIHDDLEDGRFVTAFVGVVGGASGDVRFFSAGQGPLLHYVRASDSVKEYGAMTIPLGVVADLESQEPGRIALADGDVLVLATDGVFECSNKAREQFGAVRVSQAVRRARDGTARSIVEAIAAAAESFAGDSKPADDLTIVVVKRSAAAGRASGF